MEPMIHPADQPSQSFDYWGLFEKIWQDKFFVIKIVSVVTIVTILISFLFSNKYRSTAIVLPDNESQKLGGIGGLADLASIAGVSVGTGKSWVELYPQILVSDAILKNVILTKYHSDKFKDSVNLIEYFEYHDVDPQKNYDKTYEKMIKSLDISLDKKTRIIAISMLSDEPQVAADIINTTLKRLDEFIRTKRISSASERRKWIDHRLSDVKNDLTHTENALREFRERNRAVSGSPLLLLEQQRLIRDVEINSAIFLELKKQLELAKIDEINTMPIINILDAARITTIKESPRRSVYVLLMFMFSFIGSLGYVGAKHLYGGMIQTVVTKIQSIIKPRLKY